MTRNSFWVTLPYWDSAGDNEQWIRDTFKNENPPVNPHVQLELMDYGIQVFLLSLEGNWNDAEVLFWLAGEMGERVIVTNVESE